VALYMISWLATRACCFRSNPLRTMDQMSSV
jgi:hypothetical protein